MTEVFQCEKIAFDSWAEAQAKVTKAANMRIYVDGKRIKGRSAKQQPKRVYKCQHCGKFHLTHIKKWRKSASSFRTIRTEVI